MNKVLILFCVALTSSILNSSKAESNLQAQVDSLSSQIETLTHDINYITAAHEVCVLNADIQMFTLQVDRQNIDMSMEMLHNMMDRDLYKIYEVSYNQNLKIWKETNELIKAKQKYLTTLIFTSNFYEEESSYLWHCYGMTDALQDAAKCSIDKQKKILDFYYKHM